MSDQKKLSMLQSLLARVQKRAGAPRPAAPVHPPAARAADAEPADDDNGMMEQVPPSAPRVRDAAAEMQARADDERRLARAASPAEMVPEDLGDDGDGESPVNEEDMEIAITISDSPPPPPGDVEDVEIPPAAPVPAFREAAALSPSPPPPPPPAAHAPPSPPPREELSWRPDAPAGHTAMVAPAPSSPAPPSPADPSPIAVRLMVESAVLDAAPGRTAALAVAVEVTAEVHAGAPLRGAVGTFIEQSRAFSPRSFGELLEASLGLGSDT